MDTSVGRTTFKAELKGICASLKVQLRVIHALIMREIITRYGRHNIGFAWMFAEPMMFTLGIVAIWSAEGHGAIGGAKVNVASFAITGYSTILVWRNTIGRCMEAVSSNRSLLFHRNVKVFDVFAARVILELGGITMAMIMIYAIFVYAGLISPPADLIKMFAGWLLLCWYSVGMAFLIGGLSEYSELVDKIWHPLAYFQLPLSGAMIMAHSLPPALRNIVMIFPVPNCVELYRSGYYGSAVKAIYDVPYTAAICAIIFWLGLFVVRDASKRSD